LLPVADGQTIVNMPPVLGRYVGGIDIQCFDNIDRLEHLLATASTGASVPRGSRGRRRWLASRRRTAIRSRPVSRLNHEQRQRHFAAERVVKEAMEIAAKKEPGTLASVEARESSN
jgi:hypothetical protein